VALTPAGRAFHTRAQVAATELRKAGEEAAQTGGSGAGRVTFGMGRVGVATVLPEAVARFRRQFPLARIRVVEGYGAPMLAEVRNEALDFAFFQKSLKALDASIRFRPLFRSAFAVCARKGHPLGGARALSDLADADWLDTGTLWEPGGPGDSIFRAAGLKPPQSIVQCLGNLSIVTLLSNSDLLTLLQRHLLEFLQEITVAEAMPSVTVGLYIRADTPLSSVAAAMVRHVTAVAREVGHVS
jgi:LysR family transcriptional regulator, regulator of abg operon